jgi:hypothetical protein
MSFYDEASWVLIPEGIKEDVVYAQKPTDGLGDLQFTRASDATRTNSAGVIERTPWNLVTFSEEFSNAAWTKSNTSISANTSTAPNGTLTADTFTADGSNSAKGLLQTGVSTLVNGQTYTTSIYAKRGTNNFIQIVGSTAPYINLNVFANFNLLTGAVGTVGAGSTASITDVGNGWYRCTMTASTLATTSNNTFIVQLVTSATAARGESNTLSTNVILWGAQLVEGTDAKPYFATTNRQDVPRLDYRNADGSLNSCPRLLLEPQRTNSIRNSTMVGAVAGSPGTLPTNWANVNAGLTRTVVGVGTENGLPYVDVRFNGTASATNLSLRFEGNTQVAASNGQTWTNATYIKRVAGDVLTGVLGFSLRDSGGGSIANVTSNITLSQTLQRFSVTQTISAPTTAFIIPLFDFNVNIGQTYDFTIRIAAPQMELGAYATTFIPTTTAAVTRLADTASKTGVSSLIGQTEGTLFLDFVKGNNDLGVFQISDGTTLNRVYVGVNGINIIVQVRSGGGTAQASFTFAATNNITYKCAIAYKENDFVFYVNGNQEGIDTSGLVPASLTQLQTSDIAGSIFVNPINQAALFPTRLTNAQLAEITTI